MGNILSEVCNIESLCVLVTQSCLTPCDPMDCSPPALLSIESCKQEYWSGLSFPSPGDLPDPGIKTRSPVLQADSLPSESQGSPVESLQVLYHIVSFTCGILGKKWNKGTNIKKKKKQIQTHNHREQTDEWQKLRGWVEGEWNRWGGLRGTHKINESLWWNVKHREYSNNILWWQMVTRPHGDHCNVYKYEITIFLKFWANSIHARRE